MATYTVYNDIQITDVNGDSALVRVQDTAADTVTLATAAANLAIIVGVVAACTNGKVTSSGMHVVVSRAQISASTAPPPTNATYPSVTDGARLNFSNSSGGTRNVTIPAPLLSDFISGTNTVNPSDSNIAPLIAELEALTDLSGSTNLFQGGEKVAHHSRKRVTRKHL